MSVLSCAVPAAQALPQAAHAGSGAGPLPLCASTAPQPAIQLLPAAHAPLEGVGGQALLAACGPALLRRACGTRAPAALAAPSRMVALPGENNSLVG